MDTVPPGTLPNLRRHRWGWWLVLGILTLWTPYVLPLIFEGLSRRSGLILLSGVGGAIIVMGPQVLVAVRDDRLVLLMRAWKEVKIPLGDLVGADVIERDDRVMLRVRTRGEDLYETLTRRPATPEHQAELERVAQVIQGIAETYQRRAGQA